MELSLFNADRLNLLPEIGREVLYTLLPNKSIDSYFIGGGVRDLVIDRPTVDIDVLIVADPKDGLPLILNILKEKFTKVRVTQDLTDYLTAKVEVGIDSQEIEIDLVFAREERFTSPGEKAQIKLGTLETDLFRRDFSINALALTADKDCNYSILDLVGGLSDLKEKKLRILHPNSFQDDPIRILRGIRLGARMNLEFESQTETCLKTAILDECMLKVTLGRRVFELGKFIGEPNPFLLLARVNDLNLLSQVLSVKDLKLSNLKTYQQYVFNLGEVLGFWAYVLSSFPINNDLLSVLPLKKMERKLVMDAIERG